ncbi:hypothetical protein HY641_00015 [Candidatus Woesearchaeota archaeon]|nr:hypothetical protein [Candidatus Woesearchaeota archaeon]
MNISKLFGILLISMVAATALASAASQLDTSVVNPTGRRAVGPAAASPGSEYQLQTTRGRMLGKTPVGYLEGKPRVVPSRVPEVRKSPRFQSDVWRYEGGRCEVTGNGMLRFTVGYRSCYYKDNDQMVRMMLDGEAPITKVQRTMWNCAKPQTLQCKGKECPTSVCRAPAHKVA